MARVGGESSEVCVVGPEYCNNKAVELGVVRKVMVPKPDSTIYVSDCENNPIFTVEDRTSDYGLHKKLVLLDGDDGAPILTFLDKIKSVHCRWNVYKGNSEDQKDLIYTAKQSAIMGSNKELNVYLASNKEEKTRDFRVGASSDKFYLGDSRANIIAEMNGCTVKVYPNVDQAFIISLIVILDAMNRPRGKKGDVVKIVLNGVMIGVGIGTG